MLVFLNYSMRVFCRDFMAPGARFEINVDSEAMSSIQEGLRDPSAYVFDLAQVRVFHANNILYCGVFHLFCLSS